MRVTRIKLDQTEETAKYGERIKSGEMKLDSVRNPVLRHKVTEVNVAYALVE
jgi:hypothetical protein